VTRQFVLAVEAYYCLFIIFFILCLIFIFSCFLAHDCVLLFSLSFLVYFLYVVSKCVLQLFSPVCSANHKRGWGPAQST